MPDEQDATGDKLRDSVTESPRVSDSVNSEVQSGTADLTKGVKDYYAARRDGMRDPHTSELLPPQPQFFDSSMTSQSSDGSDLVCKEDTPPISQDQTSTTTDSTSPAPAQDAAPQRPADSAGRVGHPITIEELTSHFGIRDDAHINKDVRDEVKKAIAQEKSKTDGG